VPLKNLRPVGGVPLVARVGRLVADLDWVDRAVVSTDHAGIADAARAAGLEVPFYRPPELSGDWVGDVEVLTHALHAVEAEKEDRYDVVVMLQPTSPLRCASHVTGAVDALLGERLDAVWTVSPTDPKHHPRKQLRLEGGRLAYWDPEGASVVARQQLPPLVHRNGAAYALTRECLLAQKTLLGAATGAIVVDEPMVSIDTLEDFARVERLLAQREADERSLPDRAAASASASEAFPEPAAAARAEAVATDGRSLTFVVDIDGVLASLVPDNDYARAEPLRENIARVNALHARGHRIVLFTARGSATGRDWTDLTRRQMRDWGVRHHELRFGKPAADFTIDDRSVSLEQAVDLTAGPARPGSCEA